MYIRGASHEQGGVPIEAEGGEMIINKISAARYAPLLSAINQAGGGVPFVSPASDGGYTARTIANGGGISKEEMKEVMKESFGELKIYTAIDDVRRANTKYSNITQTNIDF